MKGNCPECHICVARLEYADDGEIYLVVSCSDCQEEVYFHLKTMVDHITVPGVVNYDQMLEDFVPKGRPN